MRSERNDKPEEIFDNEVKSTANQIGRANGIDEDTNGVVDNSYMTVRQLAAAIVMNYSGAWNNKETAKALFSFGVSGKQWNTAFNAYMVSYSLQ